MALKILPPGTTGTGVTRQVSQNDLKRHLAEHDTRAALLEHTIVDLPSPEAYAVEIRKLWSDAEGKFLQIGRYLNHVRVQFGHGSYEAMVREMLPFSESTARKFRRVAHMFDGGKIQPERLPRSYTVVLELTALKPDELDQAEKENIVRPDLTIREIVDYKRRLKESRNSALDTKRKSLRQRLLTLRRLEQEIRDLRSELGDAEYEHILANLDTEPEGQVAKEATDGLAIDGNFEKIREAAAE
jgi:hypothetical protein